MLLADSLLQKGGHNTTENLFFLRKGSPLFLLFFLFFTQVQGTTAQFAVPRDYTQLSPKNIFKGAKIYSPSLSAETCLPHVLKPKRATTCEATSSLRQEGQVAVMLYLQGPSSQGRRGIPNDSCPLSQSLTTTERNFSPPTPQGGKQLRTENE